MSLYIKNSRTAKMPKQGIIGAKRKEAPIKVSAKKVMPKNIIAKKAC